MNPKNPAHKGIISRLEENLELFGLQAVEDFFQRGFKGAPKGLISPIGNGNGKLGEEIEDTGKGDVGGKPKEERGEPSNWRADFDTYLAECRDALETILHDNDFILKHQRFYPGIDVPLSLEKAFEDFWGTKEGWKHKKQRILRISTG